MSNVTLNEFEAPSTAPMSKEAQLNHLPHLEDLLFEKGYKGIDLIVSYLQQLQRMLTSGLHNLRVSVKWDGSPSLLCGTNPDNGKFFVATKSAFNKIPKLNYTEKDIENNHGNGILSYILKQALKYLPELNITNILQGDFLFTHADLVTGFVDNNEYIMFKPNTIIYAIPLNTNLAHIIQEAKIGIVFHTEYTGITFSNLEKQQWHDNGSLTRTKDVWFRDASFIDNGYKNFTEIENLQFERIMQQITTVKHYIVPTVINKFVTLDRLKNLTTRFTNYIIRSGRLNKHTVAELYHFIEQQCNENIIAGKTVQIKVKRTKEKQELLNFISINIDQLYLIFGLWNLVVDAKHMIIDKFGSGTDNNIKTFVSTKNAFSVTNPEGFVVVRKTGEAIKLVNRFEFAFHNFNNERND